MGLGGHDPLTRFTARRSSSRFAASTTPSTAPCSTALTVVRVSGGRIDLEGLGIKGPSSTWTYLVNDDPFRNQIGMMLTGPGKTTFAIYAAS